MKVSNSEKNQRKGRGSHPNSKANLKPFEKGKSGNPNGPMPGYHQRGTVYGPILGLKVTEELPDGSEREITLYEAIALGQAKSAMKGNTNAWKEIQDSIHGKMPDRTEIDATVEHTGEIAFIEAAKKIYGSE